VSLLERLHSDHKARLARIEAAAHTGARSLFRSPCSSIRSRRLSWHLIRPSRHRCRSIAQPVPWRKEWISTITRIKLAVLEDYPGVTLTDIDSRRREYHGGSGSAHRDVFDQGQNLDVAAGDRPQVRWP
jgi:hypothetical protein